MGQSVVPPVASAELGQDVGADGVYGKATERAVRELQYFYRLPPSGIADQNLLFLLGLGEGEGLTVWRKRGIIGVFCLILVGLCVWFQATRVTYVDPEVRINPNRLYTLEFWDYPLPIVWEDGTNYQDFVQQLIAEFEREYPNISINYRPLPCAGGTELLDQALRRGSPPDVYSEPFPRGLVYHQGLQVPITNFLGPEEKSLYYPGVLAALEREGDLWGWPAWFSPLLWAGNRQVLEKAGLDVNQVQTLGWTWEEFLPPC